MIDTGASCTVVDAGLVAPLGLTPTGQMSAHTPSTNGVPHRCNQYDVQLIIPSGTGQPPFWIQAIAVMETNLAAGGISGLIGRDVLSRCVLVYSGSSNLYILSY
ncbi:hypothetical protein [Ralstonia solanacearum]|uniref:hypothetical protein n=1 Tax=Ralstonia solanacearum TaxID=305 RepID=UPI0012D80BE8|nr:hypothetical protein [Ralstonia solanacearum]